MPKAAQLVESDRLLMERLFRKHSGKKKKYGSKKMMCIKMAQEFNASAKQYRSPHQIQNYIQNSKRKRGNVAFNERCADSEDEDKDVEDPLPEEIIYRNVRSLESTSKTKLPMPCITSANPPDEIRSLSDDLPKSWEYTELGSGYIASSSRENPFIDPGELEEPHIFDDMYDLPPLNPPEKNGMSKDLMQLLVEQSKHHHKLRMHILNEKFNRMTEVYKTKMRMLEGEYEMKKKQHERKMENLQEEYRRIKEGIRD